MKYRSCLAVIVMMIPAMVLAQPTTLPSFPGAEGFGAGSVGGRGGTVYEVTNLNDDGPGSFRDAMGEGNRIVVFRVSGTIELKSQIHLRVPNITIAGQTAPGDGICLRGYTFEINTHDVIVRFMRFRLGDQNMQESDGMTIGNGSSNVILDHVSSTWSVDEALSTAGNNQNLTIQWCLIAEGLNHSIHAKGAHGYGSLARANGPVSWYHNLWAHNNSRNPRLGDAYGRGAHPFFDVRNNVMYDFGETCSGLTQGIFNANYVGNYIKPGPSSKAQFPITVGGPSELAFYLQGNLFEGNDAFTRDNSKFVDPARLNDQIRFKTVDKPFDSPAMKTLSAQDAYKAVLAAVGAVLPKRDSADAMIIGEVRDGKGQIIDSQNQVGGWPDLKSQPAQDDSDHDGMPDVWEKQHGLNPADASDGAVDSDKDGYTNVEEFLNGTDPKQLVNYGDPKNNVDALTAKLLASK